MFGPNGPLPQQSDGFRPGSAQRNSRDSTWFAGSLDIFHQRMLSFFYRAWASQSEERVDFDRAQIRRQLCRLILEAFFGIGISSLSCRTATRFRIGPRSILPAASSAQTRNAEGLEAILARLFSVSRRRSRSSPDHWMKIPAAEPVPAWENRLKPAVSEYQCDIPVNGSMAGYSSNSASGWVP